MAKFHSVKFSTMIFFCLGDETIALRSHRLIVVPHIACMTILVGLDGNILHVLYRFHHHSIIPSFFRSLVLIHFHSVDKAHQLIYIYIYIHRYQLLKSMYKRKRVKLWLKLSVSLKLSFSLLVFFIMNSSYQLEMVPEFVSCTFFFGVVLSNLINLYWWWFGCVFYCCSWWCCCCCCCCS